MRKSCLGHLQTALNLINPATQKIHYQTYELQTSDNDFFELDFAFKEPSKNNRNLKELQIERILLLIPGLESNSASANLKNLAALGLAHNYQSLVMNLRSLGKKQNRLLKSYHAGKDEDLIECLDFLKSNYKYKSITIVGLSLGGNLALKALAKLAKSAQADYGIDKAIIVSAPIDLKSAAYELSKKSNRIYMFIMRNKLLKNLKLKLKNHEIKNKTPEKKFLTHEFKNKLSKVSTFIGFDQLVTAPLNQFANAEEYWYLSSAKNYLDSLTTKTLIINSLDDPFLGKKSYLNNISLAKYNLESIISILNFKNYGHLMFFSLNLLIQNNFRLGSLKLNNQLELEIVKFLEKQ